MQQADTMAGRAAVLAVLMAVMLLTVGSLLAAPRLALPAGHL